MVGTENSKKQINVKTLRKGRGSSMKDCQAGCNYFTCGSIAHVKDCVNYSGSMQEMVDDKSIRIKELEDKLQFLVDDDLITDSSVDREIEQILLK
jgi:hypothetical protein